MTPRYLVAPIATAACDDIHRDVVVLETDDLGTAQAVASHGPHLFGTAILDRVTGKLDVGYGFGVPCPDFSDP
jgi:hypothetical protein